MEVWTEDEKTKIKESNVFRRIDRQNAHAHEKVNVFLIYGEVAEGRVGFIS